MSRTQFRDRRIAPDAVKPQSVKLEQTDIHDVLRNERRVAVLELLHEESPRKLSTLAEEIAAAETGENPPPRNKRQSAYTTLHQTHLPKLDDLDIVDYDAREKVVYLDVMADRIFIEREDEESNERESAWAEGYIALVGVGLLAAIGSGVGVPVITSLSVGSYAVATLLVLLVALAFQIGREGSPVVDRVRDLLN